MEQFLTSMTLQHMGPIIMSLPFVSIEEKGPLLLCPIFRQDEYCKPQREVRFSLPWVKGPLSLLPFTHPPFLIGCLQSYKQDTEALLWQARHIQEDSAQPEAVG